MTAPETPAEIADYLTDELTTAALAGTPTRIDAGVLIRIRDILAERPTPPEPQHHRPSAGSAGYFRRALELLEQAEHAQRYVQGIDAELVEDDTILRWENTPPMMVPPSTLNLTPHLLAAQTYAQLAHTALCVEMDGADLDDEAWGAILSGDPR